MINQIASELRNKGFQTEVTGEMVIVSLNRKVYAHEIKAAITVGLNVWQSSNVVIVSL